MWMIIPMVFVLTVVGSLCQNITLDTLHQTTPCTSGLRLNTDSFIINGTIAENVTDYFVNLWQDRIYIEVLTKTSGPTSFCPILVTSASCSNPDRTLLCYCDNVNPTTGHVHFVVTSTASLALSGRIMRAQWRYNSSTAVYSNNQILPEMYDVKAAELKLNIYGVTGNLTTLPGACNLNLTLNSSNSLKLCCYNTATPCYPQISFRGDVVSSNNSCVSYPTSQRPPAGATENLVLSVAVCNQADYVLGDRCMVTTIPEDETTTTSSTTIPALVPDVSSTIEPTTVANSKIDTVTPSKSTNPSAAGTEQPKNDERNIPLIVCLSVILPIACIAGGAGVWWYYKKKSKSSKISANQSEPKAEHPNNDGQDSGHTNQAFDGGQTSLSKVIIDEGNASRTDNSQQHGTVEENGSNKQITNKTNDGSANKNLSEKSRQLPPIKGTQTHNHLQPPGQSRPASVEITSSPAGKPNK